ncbi:MAG TPA: hypothetical protein VN327_12835 [Pseudonocardiaceae bacterium]|nr:hypothetical protein [Pseudonocardiaceae bacterium]
MLLNVLAAVPIPTIPVPNPPPEPPPGLANFGNQIIAWLKWGVLIGGMVGMLICSGMVILGRRNRSSVAQDGLVGSVWVIGGLAMASVASVIVGTFVL